MFDLRHRKSPRGFNPQGFNQECCVSLESIKITIDNRKDTLQVSLPEYPSPFSENL